MSEPSSQEPKEQQEESNLDLSEQRASVSVQNGPTLENKTIEGLIQAGLLDSTDVRIGFSGARKQTRDRRPERGRGPAAERREGPVEILQTGRAKR